MYIMGIYSTEAYGLAQYDIQEAQGYDNDEYSAQIALIEGYQNNLTLFEGAIRCDIQEAAMRANGVNEEEIMAFSENVITSMLGKIKSFLMKVWAKIKAIFRGFMARIDSVMVKSNKTFVNRYRQEVLRKDLTDFEVKWRKPKKPGYTLDIAPFPGTPEDVFKTTYWINRDVEKELSNLDQDKILEGILKDTITGTTSTTVSEYEKDFIDGLFEDEDTDDKIDIHDVMEQLLGFRETKRTTTKANDSLEKALKQMIKQIEADEREFNNQLPGTGAKGRYKDLLVTQRQYSYGSGPDSWEGKGEVLTRVSDDKQGKPTTSTLSLTVHGNKNAVFDGDKIDSTGLDEKNKGIHKDVFVKRYQKGIQMIHRYANIYQQAATKYTAAVIKAFKMLNSGLRKVWAKAVAYNRKKDESVMMEAMAELAEYEEDIVYA